MFFLKTLSLFLCINLCASVIPYLFWVYYVEHKQTHKKTGPEVEKPVEQNFQLVDIWYQDFKWKNSECAILGPEGTACSGFWVMYEDRYKCTTNHNVTIKLSKAPPDSYKWKLGEFSGNWLKNNYKGEILCLGSGEDLKNSDYEGPVIKNLDFLNYTWRGDQCALAGPSYTVCDGHWVLFNDRRNCLKNEDFTGKEMDPKDEYHWTPNDLRWETIKNEYKGKILCKDEFRLIISHEEKIITTGRSIAKRETSNHSLSVDDMIGQLSVPESQKTKDDPGPNADRRGGVLLKGYHPIEQEKVVAWFVTLGGNYKSFKHHCVGVRSTSKHFFNSSAKVHVTHMTCKTPTKITYLYPKLYESSLEITTDGYEHHCSNENSVLESFEISLNPTISSRVYEVCLNASVLEPEVISMDRPNCTNVYMNKDYMNCKSVTASCTIGDYFKSDKGQFIIQVTTSKKSIIRVESDMESKKQPCDGDCTVSVEAEKKVDVICSDGTSKGFHVVSDLTESCPMISYWFSSKLAASLCRMTVNWYYMPWFILWLFLGYKIVLIAQLLLDLFLSSSAYIVSICKHRMGKNYDLCEFCLDQLECNGMIEYHETCSKTVCPYCRITLDSQDKLIEHVGKCRSKIDKVESVTKKEVRDWSDEYLFERLRLSVYNKYLGTSTYLLIVLIMFYLSITPAAAFGPVEDRWDNLKKDIENCGESCWKTDDVCECPNTNYKGPRVLLSMRSTPFEKTAGFMHINGTFKVSDSQKIVDVSISSSFKTAKNVVLTGTSIVTLPLEVSTGITWKLKSPEALEEKTLSLGVYEHSQIYSTIFKYYTASRTIKKTSAMKCTGVCDNDCGCKSKTCKNLKLESDRGWSCNPSWCFAISGGCTCCSVYATFENAQFIASVWDVQYEDSDLILCLNYDHPKFTCFNAKSGGTFNIENFNVKVTKVYGIDRKLPKRVMAIYKKQNNGFDFENPDAILLDPNIKNPNSIQHGDVGDYTFQNLPKLLISKDEKAADVNSKWTGVLLDRTCTSFYGPTCIYSGIVESVDDIFKSLIDTSEEIRTNYIKHSVKTDVKENRLNLKVRPKKNAGLFEVVLKVKNLELRREEKKPVLSIFKITDCDGCRGCHSGFWCIVKIALKSPDRFSLHLKANSPDFVVESTSVDAKDSVGSYNISLFTPVKTDQLTLCFQETEDCATYSNLKLKEPERMLVSREIQLVSSSLEIDHGSTWYERTFSGLKNFFYGMPQFFTTIISSWKILITIIPFSLILLLLYKLKVHKLVFKLLPGNISRKFRIKKTATMVVQKKQVSLPKSTKTLKALV